MSDPHQLAILTADDTDGLAKKAFGLPENSKRRLGEAQNGGLLQLCLNQPPKDSTIGWQFGSDKKVCDVFFEPNDLICSRHFLITITEQLRVELHNQSQQGMLIQYGYGTEEKVGKDDKRVLCLEPEVETPWEQVTVCVPDLKGPAFKICFPNRRVRGYKESLQNAVDEFSKDIPALSGLGLKTTQPTNPASLHPWNATDKKDPILLEGKKIGEGGFGEIRLITDLRTGVLCVVKRFPAQKLSAGKRQRNVPPRLTEVQMMKGFPHPNVMEAIHIAEPCFYMPYYPLGDLWNFKTRKNISYHQCISALRQILLGLRHLHAQKVTHRDLKPENVLVALDDPFTIVVSDFGLSRQVKDDQAMTSVCGTNIYMAPDMVAVHKGKDDRQGYNELVDIWSTGALMLDLISPKENRAIINPNATFVDQVNECAHERIKKMNKLDGNKYPLACLLQKTLTVKAEDRISADACLKEGCKIGLFRDPLENGNIVDGDKEKVAEGAGIEAEMAQIDDNSASMTGAGTTTVFGNDDKTFYHKSSKKPQAPTTALHAGEQPRPSQPIIPHHRRLRASKGQRPLEDDPKTRKPTVSASSKKDGSTASNFGLPSPPYGGNSLIHLPSASQDQGSRQEAEKAGEPATGVSPRSNESIPSLQPEQSTTPDSEAQQEKGKNTQQRSRSMPDPDWEW